MCYFCVPVDQIKHEKISVQVKVQFDSGMNVDFMFWVIFSLCKPATGLYQIIGITDCVLWADGAYLKWAFLRNAGARCCYQMDHPMTPDDAPEVRIRPVRRSTLTSDNINYVN